jgi:hypothetical protein
MVRLLISAARLLTEPDEPNGEYIRGQAELIMDACGLGGERQDHDEARDTLTAAICGEPVCIVKEAS